MSYRIEVGHTSQPGTRWVCQWQLINGKEVLRCGKCLRGRVAPELQRVCKVCHAEVVFIEYESGDMAALCDVRHGWRMPE